MEMRIVFVYNGDGGWSKRPFRERLKLNLLMLGGVFLVLWIAFGGPLDWFNNRNAALLANTPEARAARAEVIRKNPVFLTKYPEDKISQAYLRDIGARR